MSRKISQEELLNEHIAGLSPAKRALLELKLKQKAPGSISSASLPRRAQHSPAQLSFAQERLWFLTELDPESPAYNITLVRRLNGALDVAALQRALAEIVRRHESLRTRFEDPGGVPQQVIDEPQDWSLNLVDLSDKDETERIAEAQQLARAHGQRPFALSREPGFRAQLLRLTDTDHILLLTMHHIVSDGWSLGVLFGELQTLYEAYTRGEVSPLPELRIQYADFAVWQRQWLEGAELEKQLSYWKQQLADVTPVELPLDNPRPAAPSFRGEKHSLRLSAELSKDLQSLARAEGTTLFMVMLATFQVLLSRYSGQTDICVGTPIANRNRAELEDLIGSFVNTLLLRTDLKGDPSFSELLKRVREVALAGYAHQDLPFEKLVDELHPERTLSRNPLFDVIFAVQNAPQVEAQMGGLKLEPWGEGSKTTRIDLEVHVSEGRQGLVCTFVYATDLFKPETIERLSRHYEQLLKAVVTDRTQRVSELQLLTDAERAQLVTHWNENASAYPKQCIAELFAAQAAQQGTAIAAECGAEKLTYTALNERANQLAHHLREFGVGPEQLIAICVERSLDMLVGLLGILKAGAAYLPLDPSYPAERLTYMLNDAQPSLLLTQTKFLSQLPQTGFQTVCLDADRDAIARQRTDNPDSQTTLENLVYVMYTSGSTGYPKGVAVTQRNVVRLVKENNYAALNGNGVFLQFAPLSFDASTLEVWGALLNGARLIVFPPFTPTLEELGSVIEKNKISTLWLTAGLFHQLVDEHPESLSGVRQMLAGGDVLSVPHVEKALRFMNGNRLINGYGPTENTTFTCCHLIKSVDGRSIPIGRPLANTQVYVLDQNYQPVPVGVVGELYVGGDGLARGYLNRPAQTAEMFIPNVFSSEPGTRLYRTGDLVRYLPNGDLEFIRRVDHQVKIRGFRIEPAEIEHILEQHPDVADCVVVAIPDAAGEKFLAAYVVPVAGLKPEVSGLRSFLQEKLPEYMIPGVFIFLAALPLTPNGKVDVQALPAPDKAALPQIGRFVEPRTATEKTLSYIWARALDLERVGIFDNFFDLGGNSLKATRVMSRMRSVLNVELPLRALFESPTIAEFAQVVKKAEASSGESYVWPTVMKIQPLGTQRPIFFVAAPNVNALGYMALAHHLGEDRPLYGLQSQKYVNTKTDEYGRPFLEFSQAVVEELAGEYVKAMREVQPHGPYMLGGMCRGAHIAFEMALQLRAEGETVSLLAILDTWVMGNAYSYWFYVDYYLHRVPWFIKLDTSEKRRFLKKKIDGLVHKVAVLLKLRPDPNADLPRWDAVYWPGPSFVPKIYDGPITVFRVPKQSPIFIRSQALAWERHSNRDVQVEIVPGTHETILREPSVKILAARLTEIIAAAEATPANNLPADLKKP